MTKEDKQIIERATKEHWRIGDRSCLKRLLKKNLELYRENIELERENAELKKELKDANEKVVHLACNQNKDLKYKLTKAKEIILKLYNAGRDVLMCRTEEKAYDNLDNAINDRSIEQFLKEIER